MARIALHNLIAVGMVGISLLGCSMGPEWTTPTENGLMMEPALVQPMVYGNPVLVLASGDPQCFWETLVDVVDDYFPIESEDSIRIIGNTPTEGLLKTAPQVSPTIFEPWRHDTGDHDQRVENSIQTMRRYARIRVMPEPAQGGYWVEVVVLKEIEDKIRPENSAAGAAVLRYDSTLAGVVNPVTGDASSIGWIAKGRDTSLEQRIIGHLLSRFGQAGPGFHGPTLSPSGSPLDVQRSSLSLNNPG